MQNLAGDPECDDIIAEELDWARITLVKHDVPSENEVEASITGQLEKDGKVVFKFVRAWYYWVVDGDVPLAVAQELYKNPVGKREVRVAGHCGCPPPEDWTSYRGHGELVVDHYNIDGQRGLNLFVETLREYGLVDPLPTK